MKIFRLNISKSFKISLQISEYLFLGLVLVEQSVATEGVSSMAVFAPPTAVIIILTFSHTVTHKIKLHKLAVNEKEKKT